MICTRPPLRASLLLILASACAITPSLPETETGLCGTLVIAGGGMSDHSAQVLEEFLARCLPGPVGVIGAASSNPDSSARRAADDINEIAAGQVALTLPFRTDAPDLAQDPRAVAMIEACGGLWFTGGSQARILEALRPGGADTPAWRACHELLARGGVIGGSSAGAAMMSDPMIRRGSSIDALQHGVGPEGVELGQGMGFFPFGLCGQHFLQRGRFGRMAVALSHTNTRFGWGISEDSALLVDLSTGWIEVIGQGGLTLIDATSLTTSPGRYDNLRLTLLGHGDRIHAPTGHPQPPPDSTPLSPHGGPEQEQVTNELFTSTALRQAIHHLAQSTATSALLTNGTTCALLREDPQTHAWRPTADPQSNASSTHRLRLDIYRVTY